MPLARAFLREARLVILNEPTSWMDALAEYEVFKSFREIFAGRKALLISHRFSTVRLADYIYVLSEGRVIESGTHDELVHKGANMPPCSKSRPETTAKSWRDGQGG